MITSTTTTTTNTNTEVDIVEELKDIIDIKKPEEEKTVDDGKEVENEEPL